jgi:hypothetical protein
MNATTGKYIYKPPRMSPKKIFLLYFFGGLALATVIVVLASKTPGQNEENPGVTEASVFADWKEVAPADASFATQMPAEPQVIPQDIKVPKSQKVIHQKTYFASDASGVSYFIVLSVHPEEIYFKDSTEYLDEGVDEMVKALPNTRLVSSGIADFKGNTAEDFVIRDTGKHIDYKGKIFINGKTIYQVFIAYAEGKDPSTAYTYFTESFRVK